MAAALMAAEGARAQTPAGKAITLIGAGSPPGTAAEGDDAAAAHINNPYGLIEPADRSALYWVDNGSNRVLKLDYATRKISIVAGTGAKGYAGDGGPAKLAELAQPHEIRFDAQGNLYVVERDNYIVRRIESKTGIITTIAGTPGSRGFSGDGGPAEKAQFNQPHSIALDPSGNLYVCDLLNNRVRRVDAKTGLITTFAGNGEKGRTPDEGPLTGTPIEGPRSLEITRAGKIYLALREGNAVFELEAKSGRLKRVAGTGEKGYTGDGGPAVKATFGSAGAGGLTGPKGLTVTEDGRTMYVADTENHAIRKIDLRRGTISTVVGTGKKGDGPDGAPLQCALNRPHGVYVRGKVLCIGDSENHRIRTSILS
jgi:DNA-binding beta-propeller fold protein YncE